jgi:hypothetical protein
MQLLPDSSLFLCVKFSLPIQRASAVEIHHSSVLVSVICWTTHQRIATH